MGAAKGHFVPLTRQLDHFGALSTEGERIALTLYGATRPNTTVFAPDWRLGDLSQTALNDVARLMNNRPRKTLGWNTPAEAMAEELAAIKSTIALQT